MRIFAGVLLVMMFLVNGIAGVGYAFVGAVSGAAGEVAEDVGKSEQKAAAKEELAAASASNSDDKTKDEKAASTESKDGQAAVTAGKGAKALGAGLAGLGVFLLALAIGQLVFGVLLFIGKVPKIGLFLIALLGLGAEVAGSVLTKFGMWNVAGVITALAVIAVAIKGQQATVSAPVLASAPFIPPGAGGPGYGSFPGAQPPGTPPGYGSPPAGPPPGYGPPPGGGPPMA